MMPRNVRSPTLALSMSSSPIGFTAFGSSMRR